MLTAMITKAPQNKAVKTRCRYRAHLTKPFDHEGNRIIIIIIIIITICVA